jgi:hypothetical protein
MPLSLKLLVRRLFYQVSPPRSLSLFTPAIPLLLLSVACNASSPQANGSAKAQTALPRLAETGGSICAPDTQAIALGGSYSTNVDLTASVALAGEQGVDVVMTPRGAIAAVNSGQGASLYWLHPDTGEIAQTLELAAPVSDMAFDGGRELAIATQDKILRLNIDNGEVTSEIALAGVSRVALSADRHVGAIANKTVYLYDANNKAIFSKLRDYTEVTDLEVRSCSDGQQVYVTSFRNTSFVGIDNQRNPVQIALLEAFDFTGERQWSLFGDAAETIKQNVADTRLYRVTMGRDGFLYIAGESAGTATIFRWRGQPMSEDEQYGKADTFLSRIDQYSQLHNSGAAHLPYYARVNPLTGELVNAQMTFPRSSNTKANAMRLGDIAVAPNGQLYFGGAASASIANRDALTLNGKSVGGYAGSDRAWMAIAPNFGDRKFWTVLAEEGGKGTVQGVDAGYGYSAALSNVESGTVPVTSGQATGTVFISFTAE